MTSYGHTELAEQACVAANPSVKGTLEAARARQRETAALLSELVCHGPTISEAEKETQPRSAMEELMALAMAVSNDADLIYRQVREVNAALRG